MQKIIKQKQQKIDNSEWTTYGCCMPAALNSIYRAIQNDIKSRKKNKNKNIGKHKCEMWINSETFFFLFE